MDRSIKITGSYIKLKEIHQNPSILAFCYLDDGFYKLVVNDYTFDINEALELDNSTMPIAGFADPFVVTCIVDEHTVFVSLFH